MKSKRLFYSRILLIFSIFFLLIINWNFYEVQVKVDKWNPVIMAIVLSVVLLLVCDIKEIFRDKWFILVVVINALAIVNMTIVGTGYYKVAPLYCLSLGIYLSDKIILERRDVIIMACFSAFFFFYWTIDVKGYFKGYSINYGGLVLISGFIFSMFILEYVWYLIQAADENGIKNRNYLQIIKFFRRYPYIIIALEVLLVFLGYNIISWYRSRTAFMALVAMVVFMLIPRRLYKNRYFFVCLNLAVIVLGFLFPIVYEFIGNRVNIIDYQMFYKSLFDSRLPVWKDLFNIYKNNVFTGIGTIYSVNEIYRPGLLDTMNAFLDLLVVYGPVVCGGVLVLLLRQLLSFEECISNNRFAKMAYVGSLTMLVASYTESMIMAVPFSLLFVLTLTITNNIKYGHCFTEADAYKAFDLREYKNTLMGKNGLKLHATVLSVALPIFLIFILGPVEVYYANYDEFSFTNFDYLFLFIAAGLILFIITSTIILVLPIKVNKVLVSIISALSLASYVQYMFLNKNLIMEDGEFIESGALGNYPLITLSIYIGIVIIVCVIISIFRKKTYEIVTFISGFILAITTIAVISLFLTHITSKKEKLWYSGVDEFKVASGENVIVIVPDTFGRTALNSMLEQYPDAVDFLNDFTFYQNEDSMYFPTYPALHHMLTAYPYDDSMSRYDYTKAAFESEQARSFFDKLHSDDYTVRIYTNDILFEQVTQGMVDNIEEAHITTDRKALFKFLFKMSAYRYVPYVLKANFMVDTLELESINQKNGIGPYHFNSDFYSALTEQGLTIDDTVENAFILHHIRGTHMPYISNANNEMVEANSVSGEETSYGTMRLINEYLNRLKAIGKYDDSVIIIVADHGFYDTDSIFYIKKKGEKHDTTVICDEDISHNDFQRIVLEAIE